jgi:hypothetical protein
VPKRLDFRKKREASMNGEAMIRIIALSTVASVIGFMNCKGPTGPEGPESPSFIYVTGGVEAPTPWDSTGDAYVEVSNTSEIPVVMINGIQLHLKYPFHTSLFYGSPDFPISAGDSANLLVWDGKVGANSRTAQANIRVPSQFEITSHDTSGIVTIVVGEELTLTWSSSSGAGNYWIDFYLDYDYRDTLGNEKQFCYSMDTLPTNTSITFSPSQLFPNMGEIDTILGSFGDFRISATHGPCQEGEEGNVTGDGMGFFVGWTYGGDLRIQVSGSEYVARTEQQSRLWLQEFISEKAKSTIIATECPSSMGIR